MAVDDQKDMLDTLECPVCGKQFIPAPIHVYKMDVVYKGVRKRKYYCGWNCYRTVQKKKEEKKRGRKDI